MVNHFYLMQVPLDQVPFYCIFCSFRCTHRKDLDRHVRGYKQHKVKAWREGEPGERCLKTNPHPKQVDTTTDIIRLNQEESASRWRSSRRQTQYAVAPLITCDIPADLWNLDAPTYTQIGILESQQSLLDLFPIPILGIPAASLDIPVAAMSQESAVVVRPTLTHQATVRPALPYQATVMPALLPQPTVMSALPSRVTVMPAIPSQATVVEVREP